jgi:Na+/H+ antiporter NhaD/arsenite permease-like protein
VFTANAALLVAAPADPDGAAPAEADERYPNAATAFAGLWPPYRVKPGDFMPSVEWETLLFFAGLFIMIGALVKTGVIGQIAEAAARATRGDPLTATMLILFVSALLSGVVDNIPYTAAMSPVVLQLTQGIADPAQADALWWSLAIGADFGGNLTAIGASANVVVLGIAMRSGSPISFWEFTRKGAIVTGMTILLAAPYLWLRYFVLAGDNPGIRVHRCHRPAHLSHALTRR